MDVGAEEYGRGIMEAAKEDDVEEEQEEEDANLPSSAVLKKSA